MSKLITFFLFIFIGSAILSGIMAGGGGVVAAELQTTIDDDDTSIHLDSTTDFLASDYVIIGNEKIAYTGLTDTDLTGCIRGYEGTTAATHTAGAMVYTPAASDINSALGFSIASTVDSMGIWSIVTVPLLFVTRTLPHIVQLNWSFLSGELAIIAWFFFAAGIGLIITLAMAVLGGRRI